jgi:hypothetical protein
MRDPDTYQWADDGIDHPPSEAVADNKVRPRADVWNRVMYNITGDIRYLFGEVSDARSDIDDLETQASGLSSDGTEAEFETVSAPRIHSESTSCEVKVIERGGDAVAIDSAGVIESGADHADVLQEAIDSMSTGDSILCKGDFVLDDNISYDVNDSAFFHEGTFTLDDDGDAVPQLFNFYGSRMRIYNLTVDQDRENNVDDGSAGSQPAVLFGGASNNIRAVGLTIRNTIDSGVVIDGGENIQLFGPYLENIGEHPFYCSESEGIDLFGPTVKGAAESIRSDGYKFRTCTDVNLVSGYIEYDDDTDANARGAKVEYGSENIDLEYTVKGADQGLRVEGVHPDTDRPNMDVTIRMSCYNVWDSHRLIDGDAVNETFFIERCYIKDGRFRPDGLPHFGTVIMNDGHTMIEGGDDVHIQKYTTAASDGSYVFRVEDDGEATVDYVHATSWRTDSETWDSVFRVRDEGELTINGGVIRGAEDSSCIFVEGDATLKVQDVHFTGSNGWPTYMIRNDAADTVVENCTSSSALPDLTHEELGGERLVINGVGVNDGDPSETGEWEGEGRDGVTVTDGDDTFTYINGSWR